MNAPQDAYPRREEQSVPAPLTIPELYALPAAVDLMTAARALKMGRTTAYELAKRGEFPCGLLRYGDTYRVPAAEILRPLNVPVPEHQRESPRVRDYP